jgi:pimeloyl-ACP methyl ester carboxylesterase
MMPSVSLLEINGAALDVNESGEGEPLVLVHGSWADRQAWEFVEGELAKSFRVVSYSRRGHSDSQDGSGVGTRRQDEEDLAALIEERGLAPAHLAANSFGSSTALGLVGRRPELVRSLCAHEPPLLSLIGDDPMLPQMGEQINAVLTQIEGGDKEGAARDFVELALGPGAWQMMRPQDQETMITNAETFLEEQRDPLWASIDLDALASASPPVSLTQGDQSPPFYAAVIAQLAKSLPNAEVMTLQGAGHLPHVTHPDLWVQAVREAAARAQLPA